MRIHFPMIVFLLVANGCSDGNSTRPPDVVSENPGRITRTDYQTLEERPDEALDAMESTYPNDFDGFHSHWIENASASPLDGQRAIGLLEVACYDDITCHTIEYPLRVATLDYVEANMQTSEVLDALKWISQSYESGLLMDEPNDESGQFHGILVASMNVRMREYAEELLNPKIPSMHRK